MNGYQHGAIGGLAGMTEVLLQQPMVSIKNALQQSQPLSFSPAVLYRGVVINALSMAPISALQFSINGVLSEAVRKHSTRRGEDVRTSSLRASDIDTPSLLAPLSILQRMTIGGTAGMIAALVAAPAELVMTVQQRSGEAIGPALRRLVSTWGASTLFRGLFLAASRDGIFCASYMACGPLVTSWLHGSVPQLFGATVEEASFSQRTAAGFGGSVVAGLGTVLLTQPMDTIKTIMQGECAVMSTSPSQPTLRLTSIPQSISTIYHRSGLKYFWSGSTPRGLRLIGGIFILGQAKVHYEEVFQTYGILA